MSISDRLDQIEARAEAATPAQAETSLSMDGFNMHEDYPEYGQGQLMNAYMLGYNEGCADKPALVAAVRAVLDACDRTDASIIPSGGFEVGQKSVTQTIRMVVERKLSTVPSAAESARAIATALGEA